MTRYCSGPPHSLDSPRMRPVPYGPLLRLPTVGRLLPSVRGSPISPACFCARPIFFACGGNHTGLEITSPHAMHQSSGFSAAVTGMSVGTERAMRDRLQGQRHSMLLSELTDLCTCQLKANASVRTCNAACDGRCKGQKQGMHALPWALVRHMPLWPYYGPTP